MKKKVTVIAAVLFVLALFLLYTYFGEVGRFCDVDRGPVISEISGKGITVTERTDAKKTEEKCVRFHVQRREEDSWILVKPMDESIETKVFCSAKKGKPMEYRIDFTKIYGELSPGKYRFVPGIIGEEESGKPGNKSYFKVEFEIE